MPFRFHALTGFVVTMALACAAVFAPAASARAINNTASPIPGGVYTGHTANGSRVTIRIGPNAPDGMISGTLRVACAAGQATFSSSDGMFVARWAKQSATAKGMLDVSRITGHVKKLSSRCGGSSFTTKLSSPGAVKSKTIRYGPYMLNGMNMSMPMSADMMPGKSSSMFNMEGAMQDFNSRNVQKPCTGCYIVGMVPDFVYPNGKIANYDTNVMMHHIVLWDDSARDATCSNFPQRIFASGNERTPFVLPAGYGYYVAPSDRWGLLAELMNMGKAMQNVEPQITFYYVSGATKEHSVTPLWLDENECGNSLYSIPKGRSNTAWKYTVPASMAGSIVSIGGHVHDYGTHISLTDTTTSDLICDSRSGYGMNMAYMGNIESMSGCTGDPVAIIHAGDTLRLNSFYNSPLAENDVMGIMVAYVATGAT